ncbi:MAG: hypothetical protein KDE51_01280 [Anaerolineales bacterium]|nr:hypothetical protein [Anaerolineales bacterium]
MDDSTPAELLAYALAHPSNEIQNIKPYQQKHGNFIITLYVDLSRRGHLSLTLHDAIEGAEFDDVLAWLNLPNCQFIEKETRGKYIIRRFKFDVPLTAEDTSAVEKLSKAISKQRPLWKDLEAHRCHICHRELSDPESLRVKIGPICRQKIEKAEEKDGSMWEAISPEGLEEIWTAHSMYEKRRREWPQPQPRSTSFSDRFVVPPVEDYVWLPRQKKSAQPEPESPPTLMTSKEAKCEFCGQMTTDYWFFDGKTQTCRCRACLRQKNQ